MAKIQRKAAKVIHLGQRKVSYDDKLILLYQELDAINSKLNTNLGNIKIKANQQIEKKHSLGWARRIMRYISNNTI